jgi:hypothetical protein
MPRVARQLELFRVPVRSNGTFLFRRVLIRGNFGHISLRLYLGHGRHNFWFLFFRFVVHRINKWRDYGKCTFLSSSDVDLVRKRAADTTQVNPLEPLTKLITDFMAFGRLAKTGFFGSV